MIDGKGIAGTKNKIQKIYRCEMRIIFTEVFIMGEGC